MQRQSNETGHSRSVLTIHLDAQTLSQLERMAAQQQQSLEALLSSMIDKYIRQEEKSTRKGASAARPSDWAPLDDFLPEGADPFTRAEPAARLSFEDSQARLRFAGTPALDP